MTQTPTQKVEEADELSINTDVDTSEDAVEAISETDDTSEEVSLDNIFHVLKNSRRRHVLSYLRQNNGETNLSDVAEHIAAIENDVSRDQLASNQRKRVYVGLYQCHLPKMDDVGVIKYDQPRGDIRLTDKIEYFEEYLHPADENTKNTTRRWAYYYTGISGLGLVMVLIAASLGLPATGFVTASILTIGLTTGCAGYHLWTEQLD